METNKYSVSEIREPLLRLVPDTSSTALPETSASPMQESAQSPAIDAAIPHWTETAENLTPSQRYGAEIRSAISLIRQYKHTAEIRTPLEVTSEYSTPAAVTSDDIEKHFFGLMDYHDAQKKGTEAIRRFDLQWGGEGDPIKEEVRSLRETTTRDRNEIFSEAKSWDEKEVMNATYEAQEFLYSLPKHWRQTMMERVGITEETWSEMVKRRMAKEGPDALKWGVTGGATLAANALSESIAVSAGYGLAQVDPIQYLPHLDDQVKNVLIIGGAIASEVGWLKSVARGARSQWNLTEKTGMSTNLLTKFAHTHKDTILNRIPEERREGMERKLAVASYALKEVGLEGVYWSALLIPWVTQHTPLPDVQYTTADSLLFIIGANLAATGYEYATAHASDKLAKTNDIRNMTQEKLQRLHPIRQPKIIFQKKQ